jgi:glycosyltransferase involved in cell wall biosynthesis
LRNTLKYFYRHPDPIYYSLEKLFAAIAGRIAGSYPDEFQVEQVVLPFPSKFKTILSNIRFVKQRQGDINHITGDIHYGLLRCGDDRINLVTVHDCVVLHRYTAWNPRYWLLKWIWYDLPLRKADAVTVISESTKNELLHFTRCRPEKIRVIPNFVDAGFHAVASAFNNELPSILFVGSTPNKNLERLIAAIEGLTLKLEIIGLLNPEQESVLNKHRIVYHRSSGLTQEELMQKYIDCDLLAFPSTYEGFGLPIIEAQAIGRPVLTSDLSPMREVAGGGACLVDPYDVSDIRGKILRLLKEPAYREGIIREGLKNVERFRLDKVADQYAALYRELASKKRRSL